MNFLSILGVIIVMYVFREFLNKLGKTIPIIELMLLIAGLQWVIGPFIEYNLQYNHYKYFMYVKESTYMSYVVPAYTCFVLGAKLTNKKNEKFFTIFKSVTFNHKFAFALIVLGLFSGLVIDFAPNSLRFLFHLISELKFVGVIMLLFTEFKQKRIFLSFSLMILFINAILNAMFHSFILWSVFIFMFWCFKFPIKKWKIVITMFVGLSLMSILQDVKSEYRSEVWYNFTGNKIELFASLIYDSLMSNSVSDDKVVGEINVRLNQGWIISAIMYNVPNKVSFANGKTVIDALNNSLIPRFLFPDKAKVGGQSNFVKYTGLNLGNNTSMGVSLIGESYLNFSSFGIIMMFLLGIIFKMTYNKLIKSSSYNPILFFLTPLIFFQVVKAETELLVVVNHLFKTLFLSVAIILFMRSLNLKKYIISG